MTERRIMAIGAHADDIELHFGGTLFKYQDVGYQISYVMSTNNMSGAVREKQPDGRWQKTGVYDATATMAYRKRETAEAAKLYRTEAIHLDHPQRTCHITDSNGNLRPVEVRYGSPLPPVVLDDVPSILTAFANPPSVNRLKELILDHNPEVILTHGHAEVNPEHHTTFLLVVRAYWKAVHEGYKGSLLLGTRSFHELGRYACSWETWVDISDYLDQRLEAILKHQSQYPEEFRHGAAHWQEIAERKGAICGVRAAESYNFVNPDPQGSEKSCLLNELLCHRATDVPWGLASHQPLAVDS